MAPLALVMGRCPVVLLYVAPRFRAVAFRGAVYPIKLQRIASDSAMSSRWLAIR